MLNQELSAQIRQDLQDARMLLEQSGTQDERKKYRRAAEIILLKTLHLDPENAGARALLQSVRASAPEQSREDVPFDVPFIVTPRTGSPKKRRQERVSLKAAVHVDRNACRRRGNSPDRPVSPPQSQRAGRSSCAKGAASRIGFPPRFIPHPATRARIITRIIKFTGTGPLSRTRT